MKNTNISAAYSGQVPGDIFSELREIEKHKGPVDPNEEMPNWEEEEKTFEQVIEEETWKYEKGERIEHRGDIHEQYRLDKIIANGSFGVVYQATNLKKNTLVAIKRIFLDKRFKNRELEILQEVKGHPYILKLETSYMTHGDRLNT